MHTSGEWVRATGTLILDKQTAQGLESALTYGRRYGLTSALGIAADDDGNAATNKTNGGANLTVANKTALPIPPKGAAQSKAGKKKAVADMLQMAAKEDPTWLFEELDTKEKYQDFCKHFTGIELNDDNIDAILKVLIKK
jgi:hypothetical protein